MNELLRQNISALRFYSKQCIHFSSINALFYTGEDAVAVILLQWPVACGDSCASYLQQDFAVAPCDKDVHWVICLTGKADKTV